MQKLRMWATMAVTLGVVGLVFLVLMVLALVDISRGEADTSGEWLIVKLALLAFFFVIVAVFITTGLIFKHFREKDAKKKPE